jgi:hypothetical protein
VYNRSVRELTKGLRVFSRGTIHANEQTDIPETFVGGCSDSDFVSAYELGRG